MNHDLVIGLRNRKRFIKDMGINYLSNSDKSIIDGLITDLRDVRVGSFIVSRESFKEAYSRGIELVSEFSVSLKDVGKDIRFSDRVSYPVANILFNGSSLYLDSYLIPSNGLCNGVMLGNAFVHGIKDLSLLEYRDLYSLGEVIPVFMEFYDGSIDVIKNRLNSVKRSIVDYKNYSSMFKCKDYKDLYRVLMLDSGGVVLSYYYGIRLYEEYLGNSDLVIAGIKRVLSKEISTRDLLLMFNIYNEYSSVSKRVYQLVKK